MNVLVTKIVTLAFLAVALGVMLTLLPLIVPKNDMAVKSFGEAEPTRGSVEHPGPSVIITATSIIVPGLIAGFLAFILTKRFSH